MTPKSFVKVGELVFSSDTYSDDELKAYVEILRKELISILDENSADNLVAVIVTPYGADAKLTYTARQFDKTGRFVVKKSTVTITEIEGTGELPFNRTINDWRVNILIQLISQSDRTTKKSASLATINDIINDIKNKDINKPIEQVVVNNLDKPPRLVGSTYPPLSSTSPSAFFGQWVSEVKEGSAFFGAPVTGVNGQSPDFVISYPTAYTPEHHDPSYRCVGNDLFGRRFEEGSNEPIHYLAIKDCSFCRSSRSLLQRFTDSMKSFFNRK